MFVTLFLVPLAAFGTLSAAEGFDVGSIQSAPSPVWTAPPLNAGYQTIPYGPALASSEGYAAVTTVAAAITANIPKRGLYERNTSTSASTLTTPLTPTSADPSATACPTAIEEGTFCGFINPEDPCAKQPDGYGPVPSPDDVATFESYPLFHSWARQAKTPSGYQQTFQDLNASVSANSYLGLHTLSSYDTLGCSQWCDNTTLCTGFNLYIERDPALNPSDSCPSPASITNFKCTLWGSGVEPAAATNFGGYRGSFQVVIAGSDGYEKTNNTQPATPHGCGKPQKCSGGAIHAPTACLGSKFFPGPFDVNVCASYAQSQNEYNKKHSKWWYLPTHRCKQFNAYLIKRNGVAQGTYCSLYSQSFSPSRGTYQPGWVGGHFWGIESSCVATVDSGW